ncbi:hypothetical protein Hanom_Chr05g00396431 [Helianthus anomalus]
MLNHRIVTSPTPPLSLSVIVVRRLRLFVVGDRRNIINRSPTSPENNPHQP